MRKLFPNVLGLSSPIQFSSFTKIFFRSPSLCARNRVKAGHGAISVEQAIHDTFLDGF